MDVYYAVTNYHLLCCILHHIQYNKNDSILLISEYLTEIRNELVDNIKKTGLFNDVIIIDKPYFKDEDANLDTKKLKERINEIKQKIEKKYGKIIRESNDIYCCCDFDELGIYLIANNIKYHYFEDGCGIFSRENILKQIVKPRIKFIDELNCLGNNKNVIERLGSLKDQKEGYYNPKDIDFCVKDILKKIPQKYILKILQIFNTKKINIEKDNALLLLTMHYDEFMSREKQKEIYTSLVDYFADENQKIIIKPHPADTINEYDKIFPKSTILNRYMPSELFPYCIKGKFKKGVTCYSTSIYSLGSIINKIINFDTRIDKTYKDMDKYYAIIKFLEKTKSDKKLIVKLEGINEIQFSKLIDNYFKKYKDYYKNTSDEKDDFDILITNKSELNTYYNEKKIIFIEKAEKFDNCISLTKKHEKRNDYEFIYLMNFDKLSFENKKIMKYQNYELYCKIIDKDMLIQKLNDIQSELNKKLISTTEYAEQKQQEANNLYREIQMIKQSTSWKMTKIFRLIMDKIRKSR